MTGYLGAIELVIVLMFALGWWILELQGKRLDRKREAEKKRTAGS